MTDVDLGGGAPNGSGSAAVNASAGSANGESDQSASVVNPDDHARAIRDMHKYKDAAKSLQIQVEQMKQQLATLQTKSLQDKEDYKGLYEQVKSQLDEQTSKNESLKESIFRTERLRAVEPKLRSSGLRDDAVNLLDMQDLSDIDVEVTTHGRFIPKEGDVDMWVETFKTKHPYAFAKPTPPKINPGGGSTFTPSNREVTPKDVYQAEMQYKRTGKPEDHQKYVDLHAAYLKQKRA